MQTRHPLDDVHMSTYERERAKAQMRRAEFIVDLVALGVSKVRSLFNARYLSANRVRSAS